MKYTQNFWELPKEKRLAELANRKKKKDFLSNFNQIGIIDDQYNKTKVLIQLPSKNEVVQYRHATEIEWAKLEKRATEEIPTSHDSDWLATYFANAMLTEYCYEEGITPASIEFILWDRRIRKTFRPTFLGKLFGNKGNTMIYQQIIIGILSK